MRMRTRFFALVFLFLPWLLLAGCGLDACVAGITIQPATGTGDHTASAPNNAQHFDAFNIFGSECKKTIVGNGAVLTNVTWSVSDPVNVGISNAPGPDFGTATCHGATSGPVIVTATAQSHTLPDGVPTTATASLICR